MAGRYDDSTKQFMEDVVSKDSVTSGDPTKNPVKQSINVARALLSEKPKQALTRLVVKQGIGALAKDSFDNKGNVKVSEDTTMPHKIGILDIYMRLNDKYGFDWHDWEPETVVHTLFVDFGIDLSDDGVNIIGALQLILNTNSAHEHWNVFEKVGHAFNTNHVDFSILQPLRPDEAALTIFILNKIRPKAEYEPEVPAYIAASAKDSGLVFLPKEFFGEAPQTFLDNMNNDFGLKSKTEYHWNNRDKGQTVADAELHVQLKGLYEIKDYLEAHNVSS